LFVDAVRLVVGVGQDAHAHQERKSAQSEQARGEVTPTRRSP
jgi:hypothetical protein